MTGFLASHGLWAIFALMAVDAIFPVASELIMVFGGALASGALAHKLRLFGTEISGFDAYLAVSLAGTIGYQVGAIAGWWIGKRGGRPFLERRGRWFHITPERLDRAERWFERWEDWAVLVGRVTPVARSFISIPAGLFEVPFARYNVLTLIGNAAWCFALAGVGWALGSNWDSFHHAFRYVDYALFAGFLVLALSLLLRWRKSTTMARRGDSAR